MGIAATYRGNAVISQQIAAEARPVEFVLMDDLNALPKYDDASTPFGEVRFVAGHGGMWAECPVTGFGYWYPNLREAVRRWRVEIYGYEHGAWLARPIVKN